MRSHVALARTKSTDVSTSLCWWWLQYMAIVEIDNVNIELMNMLLFDILVFLMFYIINFA